MADLHVQTTKKRRKDATLNVVSQSATTWPLFASRIQNLVASALASKSPASLPSLAPDQALQDPAHIAVRMETLMVGPTRRWLARTRTVLRTIAEMCPTPGRRTRMETG